MPGRVGFIGLGAMGGPMALNLIKHGVALVVYDIDAVKVEPLVARGAAKADSAETVAAQVERTICMVETTAQAESVIAGDHGMIPQRHVVRIASAEQGRPSSVGLADRRGRPGF